MLIIIPITFAVLICILFYRLNKVMDCSSPLFEAMLWAFIACFASSIIITEVLSFFHFLYPQAIAFSWCCLVLAAGWLLFVTCYETIPPADKKPPLSSFELWLSISIAFIFMLTILVAIIAPTNNYDSMVYHMSRIAHWAQNRTILYYPTNVLRQLAMAPAAEYFILNWQLLLGNDYFANMAQWFCMFFCVLLAGLIAKQLGADRRGQIISSFITATLPMGILQATSTQTDYVAAFWLSCLAFFVLKYVRGSQELPASFGIAFALGLGLLTKPNIGLFAAPFLLWLFFTCFMRNKHRCWRLFILIFLIVLLFNAAHFLRNWWLFGSITGPTYDTINQAIIIPNSLANLIKYIGGNFTTPFPVVNKCLYNGIIIFHKLLHINPNDPLTSSYNHFIIEKYTPHEDVMGNPLHILLIFLCVLLFFMHWKDHKNGILAKYLLCTVFSTSLFFLFFKYHVGVFRYTLMFLVLFSPFSGTVINKHFNRTMLIFVLCALFVVATPALFMNVTRPIIPPPFSRRSKYSIFNTKREYFYFAGMNNTYNAYKKIVFIIKRKGYHKIGAINIYYEYPLWIILKNNKANFQLRHMGVKNVSASIPLYFEPEAVIICLPKGNNNDTRNFTLHNYIEDNKSLKLHRYKYVEYIGPNDLGEDIFLLGKEIKDANRH